jgi:hypothetical protein
MLSPCCAARTYNFRLFTYVDKPENKVLQVDFNGKAWNRGQFADDGITANPWKSSAANSAPFDQPFYIIMNVSLQQFTVIS